MNIVHWGAGKLGLSLAAWNAHCGHTVMCVDDSGDTVRAINAGRSPIDEPQVQGLLNNRNRLLQGAGSIYASQGGAGWVEKGIVESADIIFIIVPTPSLESGAFDLSYVEESCRVIGQALRQKEVAYTLVVCVSTIMPGDARKLIEAIEETSGKRCGSDWGFCYSPEFIRQGSIVHDYANPDVLLIGTSDAAAGFMLEKFYGTVVQNVPGVYYMSLESAEIAKIGLNATVVAKIAMANQLAWLCHHTPGANARHVLDSIGADSRIGPKYFKPGLWPGGPCFPRDCRALAITMERHDLAPALSRAAYEMDRPQAHYLSCAITNLLPVGGGTVGLLGLTYKPGVSLLEESQSLLLDRYLRAGADGQIEVIAYDPDVAVGFSVQTLGELVRQSDVIVVMTPKPRFRSLSDADSSGAAMYLSGKVLFDCWDYIGETNADKHIVLGRGE